MGEPGKDDVSKKKKQNEEVDISKLPVEKLAGAVVYSKKDDEIYLAFVHDIFGYWTLSKGHIEESEDVEVGAKREIKKELGIDVEIEDILGENEYTASHPEKGKSRKHVYYFLTSAPYQELKLESSGGLDDAAWFKLSDIPDLKIYGDILPIITKAISIITNSK